MLKPQVLHQSQCPQALFYSLPKPFIHGGILAFPVCTRPSESHIFPYKKQNKKLRQGFTSGNVKAVVSDIAEKSVRVKAVVTVNPTVGGILTNLGLQRGLDDIQDLLGKSLLLELVSAELDPSKYIKYLITKKRKKEKKEEAIFDNNRSPP